MATNGSYVTFRRARDNGQVYMSIGEMVRDASGQPVKDAQGRTKWTTRFVSWIPEDALVDSAGNPIEVPQNGVVRGQLLKVKVMHTGTHIFGESRRSSTPE